MSAAWRFVFSPHSPHSRLLVHSLGGEGYLNFEGNEFGHPEVGTSSFVRVNHALNGPLSGLTSPVKGTTTPSNMLAASGTSSMTNSSGTDT